jgi:N-methylhydantoinase A
VASPFAPGVNCAYGLLMADFRHDAVKTFMRKFYEVRPSDLKSALSELESLGRERMKGEAMENIVISRALDMRYQGQGYELEVPIASGGVTRQEKEAIEERFHVLHKRNYGFNKRGEATEVVNLRITALGLMSKPKLPKARLGGANPRQALKEQRQVFLRGRYCRTAIYDRDRLHPGMFLKGPAIIEQKDSTALVFPGHTARIDEFRNIIISVKAVR